MTNTWYKVVTEQVPLIGTGSEWFWAMLQFVIVTLTLWLIYRQIRVQTSSHVISSLQSIRDRWNQPVLLKARMAACQSCLDDANNFDVHDQEVASFFEELGMYVSSKLLPDKVIWDTYSWPVECYWRLYQGGIKEMRNEFRDPTIFIEFENLGIRMRKLNSKYGAPAFSLTDKEMRRFFVGEVTTLRTQLEEVARVEESSVSPIETAPASMNAASNAPSAIP